MMENSPLVSVIIAVKNGERYLARAIESVLAQTYENYEIIVVDGQSIDNTEKIAKSFQQVRYVRQTGEGIADAYNQGIDASRGEFIAFLSHDDTWTTNKLSSQVNYLIQHPEIQYTVAKVKFFLEEGHSIPPGFRPELLSGDSVGCIMETLVVRKPLFAAIGKLNPEFIVAEDVDWFCRAKDNNVTMAVMPEVLLHKHIHNTNLSLNSSVNNQNLLKIMRQSIERKRNQKLEQK
ncbi:glycosyltransferase [Argonema galeatum]|uniref:glycosyltransferase n=1 Tax=Argonema galeatum TaxID=2942762 RepID=UPI0020113E7D|nr:glycosyltransferase [Argonema galeatum]MCL1467395.1 glycosyltransferase [Argonema galeatum A003/A1]